MKSVQKIDLGLTGYDELFMNDAERKENKLPRIYDIPLSEIDDFPDHPFKVKLDEDMDQLVQSIKERGIITPVTLRPKEDGRYEIVCYCIEPGLSRNVGDTYHGFGEDFWDNYPSQYNNTIEPDDIKLLLGRIMQYGYQGNLSTSWRSQNDSDADKLAHAFATQLLVWETVVGERDADFDHVSTGGYDEILSLVSPNHPLYSRIMGYYDSIESSVQSHAVCPSFMSRSSGGAKTIELAWDGSQYIAELTDTNRVLSQFTFSASETGFHFSVSGNTLTITTDTAPSGNVTISATRSASRCGVLVWTDYKYGPNGGVQDN